MLCVLGEAVEIYQRVGPTLSHQFPRKPHGTPAESCCVLPASETGLLGCMWSEVAVICFSMAFALNIGLNNFSLSLVAISRAAQRTLQSHSGMAFDHGIGLVWMNSTCLSSAACPQDQHDHPYLLAALHSQGLAHDEGTSQCHSHFEAISELIFGSLLGIQRKARAARGALLPC